MRVLVLSTTFPSAAEPTRGVFVRERVRRLAHRCEVRVLAPVPWFPFNRWLRTGRATVPLLEQQGELAVHHPRFLSAPGVAKFLDGLLYALSLIPFVARLRRTFRFDVIDAHFAFPDGVAATLLGAVFRTPVVITLRGTEVRHAKSSLKAWQLRGALRRACRILTVSGSLHNLAVELGADPARVRLSPNGVDTAHFHPGSASEARRALDLPIGRRIIVSVGGLCVRKGHQRVLDVLPDLVQRYPDLLLAVVGGPGLEGDTGPRLRARARELALEGHLLLAGRRPHDEIATWLRAADLFCLATSNEGRPNAVLEALASGLPVVTTDVGGNAEIVQQGRDGLVVPLDDPTALGDAITRALATDWDRAAISLRGRAHTWDHTVEQVLGELDEVVGECRRRYCALEMKGRSRP